MTRSSLDKTLRRAYIVLGLVLLIAIAAKFADRIPGIEGTALARMAADTYEFLKDMSLVLVTVIAAYLANVFQKRSKFIERLEEEWRGIVRTKSALYSFCEKPNASADDYLAAFCRISETIDNMRVVYANVGETSRLIGLYPFAPLHDMRRALQSLDPRKRSDISSEERKLARDAILQSFYALRENFLIELTSTRRSTRSFRRLRVGVNTRVRHQPPSKWRSPSSTITSATRPRAVPRWRPSSGRSTPRSRPAS